MMTQRETISVLCGIAALLTSASVALAQNASFKPVTAKDLARNPDAYLQQRIELKDVWCYGADKGYVCATTEAVSVMADSMASSVRKSIIDGECGEGDAFEQSPECKFSLRFVPKSVRTEKGSYIRGDKAVQGPVKTFRTDTVEAVGGRDH